MAVGFLVGAPVLVRETRLGSVSVSARRAGSVSVSARRRVITAHTGCGSSVSWGEGGCSHDKKKSAVKVETKHSHSHSHEHGNGHSHEHGHSCNGHSHSHGSEVVVEQSGLKATWGRILHFAEELREDTRIAAICAGCLVAGFVLHLLGAPVMLVQGLIGMVALLSGVPGMISSIESIANGKADVDVLMTCAAFASFFTGMLFEGALLLVLFQVSHAAEHSITDKAKGDLDAIKALAPEVALVVSRDDSVSVKEVPVDQVEVGDLVLVKSSEILPCDGKVHSGTAFVSLAHMTGEATPRAVAAGDEIPAGARPIDGSITVEVLRTGAESALSRIIRLVTEARANRPNLASFIDRFGENYSTLILTVSAAIALLLPWLHYVVPLIPAVGFVGDAGSFSRGLGFLIAASPCALVMGAPVAYLSALSACARSGVLVKGGARTLEMAAEVDHVIFDKTGTLTTGDLELVHAAVFSSAEGSQKTSARDEWALIAGASLERHAVHPIAAALVKETENKNLALAEVTDTKLYPGQGIEGTVHGPSGGTEVRVGSPAFVAPWINGSNHVSAGLAEAQQRGEVVAVLVSKCGMQALFSFRDVVRSEAESAISSLKSLALRTSMLTGDHMPAAKRINQQVGGLDDVFADLKPEDKYSMLEDWRGSSGKVLMVGDGVNDAPALAGATVGVAMGLGSATAVQSADVILLDEKIDQVAWFMEKSKAADVIVKQNLVLALGVMILASLFAASGAVPLWLAVTAHEGTTILVGINGLRLLGGNRKSA